ncbi:unnamed protein product, partial [Ectocarpus sp. 8 AP-2014]
QAVEEIVGHFVDPAVKSRPGGGALRTVCRTFFFVSNEQTRAVEQRGEEGAVHIVGSEEGRQSGDSSRIVLCIAQRRFIRCCHAREQCKGFFGAIGVGPKKQILF